MRGLFHRGGLLAEIISGGVIRVGDTIEVGGMPEDELPKF